MRVSSSPRKGGMKDGIQERKQNDTLYAQVREGHLWNLQPQAHELSLAFFWGRPSGSTSVQRTLTGLRLLHKAGCW